METELKTTGTEHFATELSITPDTAIDDVVATFSNPDTVTGMVEAIRVKAISEPVDLTTARGRARVASTARKVASSKVYLDSIAKIGAERIKERLDALNAGRKMLKDSLDAVRDGVREPLAQWEAINAVRITAHKENIERITQTAKRPDLFREASGTIKASLEYLDTMAKLDFEEFADEAKREIEAARTVLSGALDAAVNREAEYERRQKEQEAAEAERARVLEQVEAERTKAAAAIQEERARAARELEDMKRQLAAAQAEADALKAAKNAVPDIPATLPGQMHLIPASEPHTAVLIDTGPAAVEFEQVARVDDIPIAGEVIRGTSFTETTANMPPADEKAIQDIIATTKLTRGKILNVLNLAIEKGLVCRAGVTVF